MDAIRYATETQPDPEFVKVFEIPCQSRRCILWLGESQGEALREVLGGVVEGQVVLGEERNDNRLRSGRSAAAG